MTRPIKTLGTVTVFTLLAACGGGGGGDGPRTIFTDQPLDSRVTGSSTIAAAGIVQSDPDGNPSGTQVLTGSLDRPTQELDIASLIADGAPNASGGWTSGDTVISASSALTGDFDFLIPVTVSENGLETSYVVGVVSRTQDLPESGSARFDGTAAITGLIDGGGSGSATAFSSQGDLEITANFGSTTLVDAVITGLSDTGMTFDQIDINGMVASAGANATFASTGATTIVFRDDGTPVTPIGADPTLSASGAFFGGDGNGPAEAGGAFVATGADDSAIFGVFAADTRN